MVNDSFLRCRGKTAQNSWTLVQEHIQVTIADVASVTSSFGTLNDVVCAGRDVQSVARSEVGLANAHDRDHPPAFARSTTSLDDLLPSASSEQPLGVQHPDSEEQMAVLPTNNQPSQGQAEPVDPFMSSESAVPDFVLQQSNKSLQCSDDAAASFNESDKNLSLLDADIPDADQLLSETQPIAGLPAAMPHATGAAAAAAAAVGRTHEAVPGASGSTALRGDDFAQESTVTIPDLSPSSSPSQALAIPVDPVYGDAQADSQPASQSALGSSQQTQLELQGTQLASSQRLDSLLSNASANMVPALEAVTAGAQTSPDTSPVPAGAPQTPPAPALITAASGTQNQEAIPTASDADGSTDSSSTQHQQQQQQRQQQQQQQQPANKDEDNAQVAMPKQDAELKPHEAAMAKAEEAERRLLTGDTTQACKQDMPRLALLALQMVLGFQ